MTGQTIIGVVAISVLVMAAVTPAAANRDILSNPNFNGSGGLVVDNVLGNVPDDWRAFAVGGSSAMISTTSLAASDVHPGSPATNGVKWQVIWFDPFGGDHGFDNDNARFAVAPGTTYWSTFYAKSANRDGSDQGFRMGFPIFDAGGFLGREPGGTGTLIATNTWQKFYGPAWTDSEAAEAHISWRVNNDMGDDNAVLIALPTAIEATTNVVQNPEFSGSGGIVGGDVTGEVPDRWRAFAVGGGAAAIETVPLVEDEVYPGSSAVDAVQWQVDVFGADQGFDDEGARFPIVPGEDYRAEFYVKSANADRTDQLFHFAFPIFGEDGGYLGREPGGAWGLTATSEWTKVVGPVWNDPEAMFGHIAWRVGDDGGQDAILIAMPTVAPPGEAFLLGDVNLDGEVNGLDVDPFVALVTGGTYQVEGDMNEDDHVNGLDVDPFVAAVVGGTQPVPEPSALLLCLLALCVVGGWRKWGG